MPEEIKVCRILKLRDDTDIIRNNLIYYYNIGIKDQFVMLHLPTDELLSIIENIQKEIPDLRLRLLYWNKEGKGLNPINADYLKVLTNTAQDEGFKWIVGSDSDEFLILKEHKTIQEFIAQYNNNKIISLLFKWCNYYIFEELDKPFYNSMIYRKKYMGWTKSIGKFNKDMYFVQGLHHIADKTYGQTSKDLKKIDISPDIAYYAHFPYRTKEQFIQKNLIQAKKFKDWRANKDYNFFSNFWDKMIKNRTWPDNLDKRHEYFKENFILDPINSELMELKIDKR